jgi:prepilin-type N-terminal cleavage/methylation domain-containing protein
MGRIDMITLRRHSQPTSFTLIELLTVIAIIAILAAIILWAGEGLLAQGSRSRAKSEIASLAQALELYKTDNGIYAASDSLYGPPSGSYSLDPSVMGGNYQAASQTLYQALSGQTNFTDQPVGNRSYFTFKGTQVGNPSGSPSSTYIQDPFGFSYGYSTGGSISSTNYTPYNGSGQFDLWSTGGTTGATTTNPNPTNTWITNWM